MTVRRTFLAGALAVALAPRAATAQPGPRALRLGVLLYGNATTDPNLRAFREALRDLGYVEGQNLTVDYRAGEGHPERLPDLAAAELAPKRLQFLREAAPRASRLAILWSPEHFDDEFRDTETAARAAGLHVQSLEMRGRAADLEAAFQAAAAWRCDALIAVSSRHTFLNRRAIVDFANRQRVPLAGGWGAWADEGGLLSYGPDLNAFVRRAAIFVDRIVRGANPADLPGEQPTKLDLVVNAKTAEMLGLAVPPSLLVRADRIIE